MAMHDCTGMQADWCNLFERFQRQGSAATADAGTELPAGKLQRRARRKVKASVADPGVGDKGKEAAGARDKARVRARDKAAGGKAAAKAAVEVCSEV